LETRCHKKIVDRSIVKRHIEIAIFLIFKIEEVINDLRPLTYRYHINALVEVENKSIFFGVDLGAISMDFHPVKKPIEPPDYYLL